MSAPPLTKPDATQVSRALSPGVKVYNPCLELQTDEVPQYGFYYTFPPNHVTIVKDKPRHLMRRDRHPNPPSDSVLWQNPRAAPQDRVPVGTIVDVPAANIAVEICRPENMGKKGYCVLLDDGHDDVRMLEARRTWVNWRLQEAMGIQRGIYDVARVRLEHGAGLQQFKPRERGAMQFLKRYNLGEFNPYLTESATQKADEALFFELNPQLREEVEEKKHVSEAEVEAAVSQATGGPVPAPAPPPEKKPITRNAAYESSDDYAYDVVTAPVAGPILLKRAKAAGLRLSTAQLEGLVLDKVPTVAKVAALVAAAEARKAAKNAAG
jgi:hypothetical protein